MNSIQLHNIRHKTQYIIGT